MAGVHKHHVHHKDAKPGHIKKLTPYQKWQQTVAGAPKDPTWTVWDGTLKGVMQQYDEFLKDKPGYTKLNFVTLKAMMLEESGGPHGKGPNGSGMWFVRPMQIGNPGDKGLPALRSPTEHADQIVPPETLTSIKAQQTLFPVTNIQAGVGYLLLRMAIFKKDVTVMDSDTAQYEVEVTKEEPTFKLIAANHGTTIDVLRKDNPTANERTLHVGQKLKYHKAVHYEFLLTGFREMTPDSMARRYNVGDPKYAKKMEYCIKLVQENQ